MKLDLSKPEDAKKFHEYSLELLKTGKKIELKEIKKPRSLSQNAYLHVCISLLGCYLGYHPSEMKSALKREAGLIYWKQGEDKKWREIEVSTKDLDTQQLTHFIDFIRMQAIDCGFDIPTPEMYKLMKFEIEQYIEENSPKLNFEINGT